LERDSYICYVNMGVKYNNLGRQRARFLMLAFRQMRIVLGDYNYR
jgi:hypothetical protein